MPSRLKGLQPEAEEKRAASDPSFSTYCSVRVSSARHRCSPLKPLIAVVAMGAGCQAAEGWEAACTCITAEEVIPKRRREKGKELRFRSSRSARSSSLAAFRAPVSDGLVRLPPGGSEHWAGRAVCVSIGLQLPSMVTGLNAGL
ncbi:hypothetical protein MHYP_G00195230 [Metynnis hypsauchen]